MNEITDSSLADQVKDAQDPSALNELIERHSGIYIQMVERFGTRALTAGQKMDLIDQKDYEIYRAANDFDASKSKFSTFLANRARYLCLNVRTENIKNLRMVDFSDIEYCAEVDEQTPYQNCEDFETKEMVQDLIDELDDEKLKIVLTQRYFGGESGKLKTWAPIAKMIGYSIQGTINLHDSALAKMKKKLHERATSLPRTTKQS